MRAPWTARRSNQSILKEINPEYSLEGLMLKLQYFGYLMQRAATRCKELPPDAKTLTLGKTDGKRRSRQQRMRRLDGITDSMDKNLVKLQEKTVKTGKPGVLQFTGLQRVGQDLATQQQLGKITIFV